MKKIYMILAFAAATTAVSAQIDQSAISACKLATKNGIRVTYNDSKSCKGDLKDLTAISMHSGVNGWKTVVDADKSPLTIKGSGGIFTFDIANPAQYYTNADPITEFDMVFNQYATTLDPATMWAKEGKAKDAATGNCADFIILVADLKACTSGTSDLLLDTKVAITPNPAMDAATVTIADNGVYTVELTSTTGQVISSAKNVSGKTTIERAGLAAGLYYVVIRNAEGKSKTQKLIFE